MFCCFVFFLYKKLCIFPILSIKKKNPFFGFWKGIRRVTFSFFSLNKFVDLWKVPIEEHIEALDWLHSQDQKNLLPRCYFSGRSQVTFSDFTSNDLTNRNGSAANGHLQRISTSSDDKNLVSVAGVGSAVLFRSPNPFSFDDWLSIKR